MLTLRYGGNKSAEIFGSEDCVRAYKANLTNDDGGEDNKTHFGAVESTANFTIGANDEFPCVNEEHKTVKREHCESGE